MSKRIILCLAIFTLVGCSSLESQIAQRNLALKEESRKCDLLLSDSRLDILRASTKLPPQSEYSITMQTDSSFVTDEQRAAIQPWADLREQCHVKFLELYAEWDGENAVNLSKIATSRFLSLIAQLYNREVTWSYFNIRRKEASDTFRVELAAIREANYAEKLRQREATRAAWSAAMITMGDGMQGYSDAIREGAANRAAVVNSQNQRRRN